MDARHLSLAGMQVNTADVSKEKKERDSWGPEKKRDILTTVHYCFRRLMLKKKPERNKRSSFGDDSIDSSFASTPSSPGIKDHRSSVSSQEYSDLSVESDRSHAKKNKKPIAMKFKRMVIPRVRRSKSDGCEQKKSARALFAYLNFSGNNSMLDSHRHEAPHRMQSTSIANVGKTRYQGGHKPLHRTFSAETAMKDTSEFLQNTQRKSKSRHLTIKRLSRIFKFLRRWNTPHTTLGTKYYQPVQLPKVAYDQAFKWSQSFDALLRNKDGLELFKGFLKSEFSEENVEFWIACEEFRYSVDDSISVEAKKIYGKFVASNAPKEVNLDSRTRSATMSSLDNPSRETFELAQRKIQALMEKDSYPRFINSELYQHILESVSKV